MAQFDITYHNLLKEILDNGYWYDDPKRTGVKRLQVDDYKIKHEFKNGFPILTTKKTYFKGAVGELLAFLSGSTDIRDLWRNGVSFWDDDYCRYHGLHPKRLDSFKTWSDDYEDYEFELGKIYPYQLRKWNGETDQIKELIKTLRLTPMATKKTVTMWNPSDLNDCCLSPCHWSFEVLVRPLTDIERIRQIRIQGKISEYKEYKSLHVDREVRLEFADSIKVPKYGLTIKWHQHSVDTFLGLPLNFMYYSVLCYFLADMCNMLPLAVIGDLSNVHLYDNQITAAKEQLERDTNKYKAPEFKLSEKFKDYKYEHHYDLDKIIKEANIGYFILEGYESYPSIKVPMLTYDTK